MDKLVPGVLEVMTPHGASVPVVCDSPHSGDHYPDDFGHRLSVSRLRLTADAFVDDLFAHAPARGVTLLRALFPRTYIDVNRSLDDLDASMLDTAWPDPLDPGPKVDLGIGLIARRDATGSLYDRKLTVAEVKRRISRYYEPYHRTLSELLDRAHRCANMVYHLNCHSMRPVGACSPQAVRAFSPQAVRAFSPQAVRAFSPQAVRAFSPQTVRAPRAIDFCIGDRDGTTSAPEFTQLVASTLRDMGYHVEVNSPYKGVELIRRYSDPVRRRNSLQIEVNRALYMDEQRVEKHHGFDALRGDVNHLLDVVHAHVEDRLLLAGAAE